MSIPKIIHYFYDDIDIWKKNNSNMFRMCYYSWKKYCPDYEIKLWHPLMPEIKLMLKDSKFLRECYKKKFWAFMSDYVRYYALYNHGGIYLDTDVQLLKNFDNYLDDSFFCSIEGDIICGENIPEPAIMGGEKGHVIFKETLDIYNSDKIFEFDCIIANMVLKDVLKEKTNFTRIPYKDDYGKLAEIYYNSEIHTTQVKDLNLYMNQEIFENKNFSIKIYPSQYFCPTWDTHSENAITDKTVSIHWNQSSWWYINKKLRKLQSLRFRNPIKKFLYLHSECIGKFLTLFIPVKNLRKQVRHKIIDSFNNLQY